MSENKTDEKKAYNIFCNDGIFLTILNDKKKANKELEKLAKKDFEERYKFQFKDYAEYRHICYWHIHETNYI